LARGQARAEESVMEDYVSISYSNEPVFMYLTAQIMKPYGVLFLDDNQIIQDHIQAILVTLQIVQEERMDHLFHGANNANDQYVAATSQCFI
jgi:hypothetical protein